LTHRSIVNLSSAGILPRPSLSPNRRSMTRHIGTLPATSPCGLIMRKDRLCCSFDRQLIWKTSMASTSRLLFWNVSGNSDSSALKKLSVVGQFWRPRLHRGSSGHCHLIVTTVSFKKRLDGIAPGRCFALVSTLLPPSIYARALGEPGS